MINRDKLIGYLIEAEVYEGRLSDFASKAGGFIKSGAKGEGIRSAAGAFNTARKAGDVPGLNVAAKGLAKSVGRSAAVYGGAALGAYGAYRGAKALYNQHKERQAEREQQQRGGR